MTAASKQVESHALLPFLQQQNQSSLNRLFQKPAGCLAVFRLVTEVERQVIMSLLFLESPVSAKTLLSWATASRGQYVWSSCARLFALTHGTKGVPGNDSATMQTSNHPLYTTSGQSYPSAAFFKHDIQG